MIAARTAAYAERGGAESAGTNRIDQWDAEVEAASERGRSYDVKCGGSDRAVRRTGHRLHGSPVK